MKACKIDGDAQALEHDGLSYALCGGLAVALHGYPRFTKDIDLLVREEDLEAIKRSVQRVGFDVDAGPIPFDTGTPKERVVHRISKIADRELLTLDLVVLPPSLDEVWAEREIYEWMGGKVTVVSAAGLAVMKRLAGRRQDLLDLEKLGLLESPEGAVEE